MVVRSDLIWGTEKTSGSCLELAYGRSVVVARCTPGDFLRRKSLKSRKTTLAAERTPEKKINVIVRTTLIFVT